MRPEKDGFGPAAKPVSLSQSVRDGVYGVHGVTGIFSR